MHCHRSLSSGSQPLWGNKGDAKNPVDGLQHGGLYFHESCGPVVLVQGITWGGPELEVLPDVPNWIGSSIYSLRSLPVLICALSLLTVNSSFGRSVIEELDRCQPDMRVSQGLVTASTISDEKFVELVKSTETSPKLKIDNTKTTRERTNLANDTIWSKVSLSGLL